MADTANIELLKKQRAAFKGQLTAFKSKLSAAISIGGVESLLRRLQQVYDKYDAVQNKLECLDDTAALDRSSFEDDYSNLEVILRDKLHDIKKSEEVSLSTSFHNTSQHDLNSSTTVSASLRLPELTLPVFNGLESDWLSFRDIFIDLIHNKTLDNTVKFLYLISSIRSGSAYSLISSIPVTTSNYETAWKLLCEKYDNETSIQRHHTRELYEVRNPQEHSCKALQLFIDKISKHYNALKSLSVPVHEWDLFLVHHLVQRLDQSSRIHVIKKTKPNSILTFIEFIEILRGRIRVLEALTSNSNLTQSRPHKAVRQISLNAVSTPSGSSNSECACCSGSHTLPHCPAFLSDKFTPRARYHFIKDRRLCGNCLVDRHAISECRHLPCNKCALKHHTLLHFERTEFVSQPTSQSAASNHCFEQSLRDSTTSSNEVNIENTCTSSSLQPTKFTRHSEDIVLLGTAMVHALVHDGIKILCRALLDSGSTMNFITANACHLLQARKYPTFKSITGIAGAKTLIKHKTHITIASCVSDFKVTLKFYILPTITNNIPCARIEIPDLSIPSQIKLADPSFNLPNRVDILLGAEIYHQLFKGSFIKLHRDLPPFYDSELGYIVSGKTKLASPQLIDCQPHRALCSIESLEKQIKRFWEIETTSSKPIWSQEESLCEEHFKQNVQRLNDGRYVVTLPTKPNLSLLGSSNISAQRQFFALETRLQRNPELYSQYRDFMNEYQSLGHMDRVNHNTETRTYYLPHHCVVKEQSETTKLRVVFNASAKTSSSISLNDCLMVGPTIQQDLFSIMLRFRKHIVAFSGDIAKMYRQILIQENQQDLQRILWRNNSSETIQTFKLRTVTYGTASAPFLAIRTLHQLAMDEREKFPIASKILDNDFYVDDLLTGATSIDSAITLKTDLIQLLSQGGFELRKFVSNIPQLSSPDQENSAVKIVLGVIWNTKSDNYEMHFHPPIKSSICTKRNLLSELCQIFDPLGICAPIILTGKLVMQNLWTMHDIGWDNTLPIHIVTFWNEYKNELATLSRIMIPRLIVSCTAQHIELHGFCDASEKAYGCVLYTRTLSSTNQYHIHLLCAKTRVAPLKKETIPRLELCAAVLLSEVVSKVTSALDVTFSSVYLWTDSQITLFRIRSEPSKYAVFVANRLIKILELTSPTDWHYVKTSENPADLASRGLMPSQFTTASLWWNGPAFLRSQSSTWPDCPDSLLSDEVTTLEVRNPHKHVLIQNQSDDQSIFLRYQSFTLLVRVVAYILRFGKNARNEQNRKSASSIFLQPCEIHNATLQLIRLVQQSQFGEDLHSLKTTQGLSRTSSLSALAAFIDNEDVLRVGGRLVHASVSDNQKHPILLPGHHPFSVLIARHQHLKSLHAGPQALLYNLRLQYWIIGGRNLCRKIVQQCVRCHRAKPQLRNQVMGNLPADRVQTGVRPFLSVGIDFCGPFWYLQTSRSKVKYKCYICLFVCFTTKAVHLEIVMSVSTESFLACLRRFVARRGISSRIYSDNATNFIGARSELKDLRTLFLSQYFIESTTKFCSSNNIEWNTIPPRSPHFGGLWEAAIKSAKHHFKRAVGNAIFTIEELLTLVSQIEACLNSRPLTPMSSDPSDLNALSPRHFLIGAPLLSIPEPSLIDLVPNRLSRFQRIQQISHHFWERWRCEYLSELQQRQKWRQGVFKFQIGSLVILQDDNLPPLKWNLGRITALHPGKDGVVRVVSVKTSQSEVKRAVNRISVLPIPNEN